jgi:hypothetical protein
MSYSPIVFDVIYIEVSHILFSVLSRWKSSFRFLRFVSVLNQAHLKRCLSEQAVQLNSFIFSRSL